MRNSKHIQPVGNSDRFKFDDWSICNYLIKNNLESSDILVFINSASGVLKIGVILKKTNVLLKYLQENKKVGGDKRDGFQ